MFFSSEGVCAAYLRPVRPWGGYWEWPCLPLRLWLWGAHPQFARCDLRTSGALPLTTDYSAAASSLPAVLLGLRFEKKKVGPP